MRFVTNNCLKLLQPLHNISPKMKLLRSCTSVRKDYSLPGQHSTANRKDALCVLLINPINDTRSATHRYSRDSTIGRILKEAGSMKLYLVVCAACLISGAVIGYLNGKYAAGARFADTCTARSIYNSS